MMKSEVKESKYRKTYQINRKGNVLEVMPNSAIRKRTEAEDTARRETKKPLEIRGAKLNEKKSVDKKQQKVQREISQKAGFRRDSIRMCLRQRFDGETILLRAYW